MKTTHNPGYYRITHIPTGKFFFGAGADLDANIYLVRYKLENRIHSNVPLRDIFTCWADFTVELFSTHSRQEALRKRKQMVKQHSADPLCCNSVIGGNHSQRFKTTQAVQAARRRGNTPEHNAKIAKANVGRRHTPEALAKMREKKPKRAILIEGTRYESVGKAAEALGMPYGTIRNRGESIHWPEWVLL